MRWRATETLAALALVAGAQASEAPRWGGEVALGAWSGNRELDEQSGIAAARGGLSVDWTALPAVKMRADLWASAYSRPSADGRQALAGAREALLSLRLPCSPALGKRVVAWGRTDVINPTDQLTPTDFRRLTPKDTEQRLGVWGLHLDCALGPGRLQLHATDPRRFHRVPFIKQPGVTLLDGRPRSRVSSAVKYELMGSGLDGSVSVIDGIDLHPTLVVRGADATGVRIGQTATRLRLIGADVAISEGPRVWRAEAAWADYAAAGSALQAQRRPWVAGVLQLEWAAGSTDTVSVQGFFKSLRGELQPPATAALVGVQQAQALLSNEIDRSQRGWTLRWARRIDGERGDLELLIVHVRPRDDGLLRLRWSHSLSDSLRLSAGAERSFGPADSYLGNLRSNALAFIEVSHSW